MRHLGEGLDRALSPVRLRRFGWCTLVMNVALYPALIARGKFPFDALDTVVAQDFLAHWTGGRLVSTGHRGQLYDIGWQRAVQAALTHRPQLVDIFISPPLVAYGYAPFSFLAFGPAAILWTAVSLSLLVASAAVLTRLTPSISRESRGLLFLLWASSQPVVQLLGSGQDTGISLLLWAGGALLALQGFETASGLVFSLGLFKPQLFFLPPLVLLLLGRRRGLVAWAASAAAQGAITLLIFGRAGLVGWLGILRSPFYIEYLQDDLAPKMTSLVPLVHSLLPSALGTPGRIVGGILSVGIVAATAWRLWLPVGSRRADERGVWALACLTTLIAAPHCFYYDLTLLVFPVALLLEVHGHFPVAVRRAILAAYVLCSTAPMRTVFHHAAWPLSVVNASWLVIPMFVLWRAVPTVRAADRDRTPIAWKHEGTAAQGSRP
jgi:Glycosyltransferase family 87